MTNFKKNDTVAVIHSWDDKGTVSIRRAIVQAWGDKVIRLMDLETREMFKYATAAAMVNRTGHKIVANDSNATLEAIALKVGAEMIEYQKAHYARCLAGNHGEGYNNAIRRDIAQLHEPRFIWI